MTDPNVDVVLAKAASLEQSMDNLRDAFVEVEKREKTNRRVVAVLAVVSVFSAVAIVVAIVFAVRANNASNDANHAVSAAHLNQQSQVATCLAGNQSRAVGKQLWLFIINASAKNPALTPTQKQQLATFR